MIDQIPAAGPDLLLIAAALVGALAIGIVFLLVLANRADLRRAEEQDRIAVAQARELSGPGGSDGS